MKPGDTIWVRVFKADGRTHRWWQARVEAVRDDCIIAYTDVGNPVYHNVDTFSAPVFPQKHSIRNYYWLGRRHDLLEVYEADGRLHELYADITSPIEVVGGEIHYIDHELDVQMDAGDVPRIVDQDEFAEAAEQFGYADAFMRECYELAEQLIDVLREWRPLGAAR